MKIIECTQGSEEWHQARAGCITASMFRVARSMVGGLTDQQSKYVAAIKRGIERKDAAAMAGYKVLPRSNTIEKALEGIDTRDFSEEAKNYAFRVAVERISGAPLDEGFETWAMRRGHELEPAARMQHEIESGVLVQRAGFATTDDGIFGASADGFIDEDGGSEYKCLISPEGMRAVLLYGDISQFTDQIQGCMWVTGRRYWHFAMYCPALSGIGRQLYWRQIERDENYIQELERDLLNFLKLTDEYECQLRGGQRAT